jgi:transcriptional regulator with XRE-family HTH domain
MARNTSGTASSRALGAELRRLRDSTGLSVRKFAERVGINYVAISKAETGRTPPSLGQVGVILGNLGVVGLEQERLLEMTRAAGDPTWVTPGIDHQLSALMDFEQDADKITGVSPLLIPGLLQIAPYARAINSDGRSTEGQIRDAVNRRMGRQQILTGKNAAHLVALIGEPALRRPIGGHDVMVEQLRHLLKMSELDNVDVLAIPNSTEYDPSLAGAFVLFEFPHAAPIVHFEHHRSSMFLPDKRDVEDMLIAVRRIEEGAMSPATTTGLIAEIINGMETTQ